jgi:hypothetical protein
VSAALGCEPPHPTARLHIARNEATILEFFESGVRALPRHIDLLAHLCRRQNRRRVGKEGEQKIYVGRLLVSAGHTVSLQATVLP